MKRYLFLSLSVLLTCFALVSVAQAATIVVEPPIPEKPPELPKPLEVTAVAFPPITQTSPLIYTMIDQVNTQTIYNYTGDLSGEWPVVIGWVPYTIVSRNTDGGTPVEYATQYINNHLQSKGIAASYHTWNATRPPNVIGEITGQSRPNDIYIISAHLDDMPGGALAPGADDNASGSVATMIAADIFSQYEWDCTLRFTFWTGEEQGLLGSSAYALEAYNNGENILGVINLDMIAWNTVGSAPEMDIHADSTMPDTVALAQQFADVITVYGLNLVPQVVSNGTGASDHASFWQYGYTAVLAIEDYYPSNHDFNPNYHTTNDTLANLGDMDYYTDMVRAAVGAAAHMSDCVIPGAPVTPTVTASTAISATSEYLAFSWEHHLNNTLYKVHRSDSPYFVPEHGTQVGLAERPFTSTVSYPDLTAAIGDPATNHFYYIVAVNGNGQTAQSIHMGEFDFSITPGS